MQSILTPQAFQQYAGKGGRLDASEAQRAGIPAPPKGYQYTYDFNRPGSPIGLKKDSSLGKKIAKGAIIGGGIAATALTGGAASPLLAAAIGAGTGAGTGAIDGGWKGALMGAGIGAAGGALGSSIGGAGGAAGGNMSRISQAGLGLQQGAGQALRSAALNPQNYAQIAGQVTPGKTGNLLSLVGGAGGGNVAGNNAWLTDLLKNPQTYGTLLGLVQQQGGGNTGGAEGGTGTGTLADILRAGGVAGAGIAGGATTERDRENLYGMNANNAATSRYGIEQGARANLLGMQEQGRLDRSALGLKAPDVRANQVVRGSIIANAQDASMTHPRAHIPKISGGLKPSMLSPQAREAGTVLQNQGLAAMKSGSDVPEMADFMGEGMVTPPAPPEYKEAGALEQTAGIAGTGSTFLAGILQALAKQAAARKGQQQTSTTPPVQGPPAPGPEPVGTDTTGWGGWGGVR